MAVAEAKAGVLAPRARVAVEPEGLENGCEVGVNAWRGVRRVATWETGWLAELGSASSTAACAASEVARGCPDEDWGKFGWVRVGRRGSQQEVLGTDSYGLAWWVGGLHDSGWPAEPVYLDAQGLKVAGKGVVTADSRRRRQLQLDVAGHSSLPLVAVRWSRITSKSKKVGRWVVCDLDGSDRFPDEGCDKYAQEGVSQLGREVFCDGDLLTSALKRMSVVYAHGKGGWCDPAPLGLVDREGCLVVRAWQVGAARGCEEVPLRFGGGEGEGGSLWGVWDWRRLKVVVDAWGGSQAPVTLAPAQGCDKWRGVPPLYWRAEGLHYLLMPMSDEGREWLVTGRMEEVRRTWRLGRGWSEWVAW